MLVEKIYPVHELQRETWKVSGGCCEETFQVSARSTPKKQKKSFKTYPILHRPVGVWVILINSDSLTSDCGPRLKKR